MSSVKVLAAPHTGMTVRSLDRAVSVFRDVLNLPIQRTAYLSPPVSTVVGHSQAVIHTAFVELPDGHLVELLEYQIPPGEEQRVSKPLSWEPGSWHLCLTVNDLEATMQELTNHDAAWQPMAAHQTLCAGPNAGKKVVYMRNQDDGLILELFG